jgi:hypothetical protein
VLDNQSPYRLEADDSAIGISVPALPDAVAGQATDFCTEKSHPR